MRNSSRIQRRLNVEELEPRVAPVSLAGAQSGVRTDAIQLDELTVHYDFAMPSLEVFERGGEVLSIDGTELSVTEGWPVLPYRPVNLLLPPGTDLAGVDVRVDDPVPLGTLKPLVGGVPSVADEDADEDVEVELSPDWTPRTYEIGGVQRIAGYTVATISLYPVAFDPVTSEAVFYSSMTVTAKITAANMAGDVWTSHIRQNEADRAHVAALIDNPTALSEYDGLQDGSASPRGAEPLPAGSYDYVIITSSQLEPVFETLRDFKESRGVRTTITTTSYIYDNYSGVDQAEQVRNFIRDAYSTWGISYVLLGGDIDVVPHRGAYVSSCGYTETSMPADIYFACLDGSWNGDGDAYWGEANDGDTGGNVDLYAEVYVGRAPVDSITQATNFINKTISYETNGPANANQALWVGEYLWNGSNGAVYGSHSKNVVRTVLPQDYEVTTLYEEQGTFSRQNVLEGLNAGPHVVNHLGHANQTYVLGIGNNDVDTLTNEHPFLVYSQGCLAGAFDYSDSIAEHFVYAENGAFAAVMNSRYGWGSSSGIPGYSHDFDQAFFKAIYQDGYTNIGVANQLAKEYNIARVSNDTYRWIYYELNLLGDPQTPLYDGFSVIASDPANGDFIGDPPTTFTVDFNGPYDPTTVEATDLVVNGHAAQGVIQVDTDTLEFFFATSPVTSTGTQSMHINAGAILANDTGAPLKVWDARFTCSPADVTVSDSIFPQNDHAMDFGSVLWDGAGGEKAAATFTIRNDGGGVLDITGVTGPEGPHFSISGLPGGSFTLESGEQVVGTVIFDPLAMGPISDQITIESSDPDEATVVINLQGSGACGDITVYDSVSPNDDLSIDFGLVNNDGPGGAAGTATFIITNNGDADLTIEDITVADGTFSISAPRSGTFVLGPGGSCAATVTFDPTSNGVHTGTITITSNDPDEGTVEISLRGDARGGIALGGGRRSYSFTDANGDKISVSLSGSGTAFIVDANGGTPNGTDIGAIALEGTNSSTRLSITCGGGGAGDVILGDVATANGQTIGSLSVSGGTVTNTHIAVDGSMGMAMLMANGDDFDLTVTGGLNMLMTFGRLGGGSEFDIGGDATMAMLMGELNGSSVSVGGDVMIAFAMGGMRDGSSLTIGGDLTMAMLLKGMENSSFTAHGDTGTAFVMGGMRNGSSINMDGNLGMGLVMGGLENSSVNVACDVNMLMLMGGNISDGSEISVGGDVGMAFLMGDILDSTVDVNGRTNMLFLFGDVGVGGSIGSSDVKFGLVLGAIHGEVKIHGDLTGNVMLFKGIEEDGHIDISGNLEGRINSFGHMEGDVSIGGHMSGELSATLFGDVTIEGTFRGRIASTRAGSSNTLRVEGITDGGVVTHADAFATYVGYPEG